MRGNKGLVYLVSGLGVIIIFGLIALAIGVVMKSSDPNFSFLGSGEKPIVEMTLDLPTGATVIGTDSDGGLLHVHIQVDGAHMVLTFDPLSGRLVRRINLKPPGRK
ncbi:MAG: hypothetical protein HQ503_06395 [Rhodospirillales bacterium]|nr:hypothetical protein [Rhodospirillales bacterium]